MKIQQLHLRCARIPAEVVLKSFCPSVCTGVTIPDSLNWFNKLHTRAFYTTLSGHFNLLLSGTSLTPLSLRWTWLSFKD